MLRGGHEEKWAGGGCEVRDKEGLDEQVIAVRKGKAGGKAGAWRKLRNVEF